MTQSSKFPLISALVCVACLVAMLGFVYPPFRAYLDKFEYWTADWRTALLADRVPANYEKVVLVVFDPETFNGAVVSPIPRDVHAQVLRAIDAMEPRAIGLDFYFIHEQSPAQDAAMLDALNASKAPIVLGTIDSHTTEFNEQQQIYQQNYLTQAKRPAGYLALRYDPGHVVRRTSPPLKGSLYQESFARQVFRAAGGDGATLPDASTQLRIAWLIGGGGNTEPFLKISAKKLLPGADAKELDAIRQAVRGNVVLTGIDMPNSDRHDTALSVLTGEKMLGVIVHAHTIAQLLDGRYFIEVHGKRKAGVVGLAALIGCFFGWFVGRRRATAINLGAATAVLVILDAALYSFFRIVLPFAPILFAWFISAWGGRHAHLVADWVRGRQAA